MGLDLRLPLGLMFLVIGVILLGYGALTWHDAMYARSLGANVNVIWGAIMCLFGGTMFVFGKRSRDADRTMPAGASPKRRSSH